MTNKKMFLVFLFNGLLMLPLFMGCSNEVVDETPKNLRFSVSNENGTIVTDNVDYEFTITEGNGGYLASVSEYSSDKDAVVTIEGDLVKVSMLNSSAIVTICDSRNQMDSISIKSTNKSLDIVHSGLMIDVGGTYFETLTFGAGAPYTIEKVRGSASDAVVEGDQLKITSLSIGDTQYRIRDKRGSIQKYRVSTSLQFEMDQEEKYLWFEGVNNLTATVKFPWGTKWQIIGATEKALESATVGKLLKPGGGWTDYYVLFIHTTDTSKGTDTITLKNSDGEFAVVKLTVY